ncbi:hypothetical protein B0H19DRAFT_1191469 [Mycena capillaripes]|nr:hypothetical protein B0H19DRAFT_1191469 [Mycena capillaripes]
MRSHRRSLAQMILLPSGVNALYSSTSLLGPMIVYSPVHECTADHVITLCDAVSHGRRRTMLILRLREMIHPNSRAE